MHGFNTMPLIWGFILAAALLAVCVLGVALTVRMRGPAAMGLMYLFSFIATVAAVAVLFFGGGLWVFA